MRYNAGASMFCVASTKRSTQIQHFIVDLRELATDMGIADDEMLRILANLAEGDILAPQGGTKISVGVAVCPKDASDEKGLFRAADQAMYKAKKKGANGIEIA